MRNVMRALSIGLLVWGSAQAEADVASTNAYKAAMDTMMMGMMQEATGMPDVDFVKGMIPHHQGAVAMAEVELKFGKDKDLIALAQHIKDGQTAEIKQMQDWLASPAAKATKPSPEAAKQAADDMEKMMGAMAIDYTDDVDVDFVTGMIPHHQAALAMAETELKFGSDADIKALAAKIKAAQAPEIEQMQKWLAAHKPN